MIHYDATRAEVLVHTAREGVLSAVGHDLELIATALGVDVDVDAGTVDVRIDARAIRLRGALVEGRVVAGSVSAGDTRTIEQHLREDVLAVARFPEIRFVGRILDATPSGGHRVEGTLTLHGVSRPMRIETRRDGAFERAEVELEQSDFGIKPFRAMLGALRVRSRVVVKLSLSRDDANTPHESS
jgi:polyisoprenoid-binding protein YceI